MKINNLIIGGLLAATPVLATADMLSITVGGGVWNETPEGGINNIIDTTSVDVKNQLLWTDESQGYLFATLEHPIPILPNVRLMYTSLDQSGSGFPNPPFEFDGVSFSGNISNDFSIEETDLLFYYEVLDNVVSLDLGLNVRLLDITYNIADENGNNTSDSVSGAVPMIYGLVGGSPWPGVLLSAELNYIGYSGSTISDFIAKISYTTDFFVGFEGGYRAQTIELDDVDDTDANLDFKGPFIGAYVKF